MIDQTGRDGSAAMKKTTEEGDVIFPGLRTFTGDPGPDSSDKVDKGENASSQLAVASADPDEDALLKKFASILADRERRIVELEQALRDAEELTRSKIQMLQKIRLSYDELAVRIARIEALEKNTARLNDTRMLELLEIMDGVESGVSRIYQTRRWRIANIVYWVRGLFYPRKRRPFRGYWRIDTKLTEYHTWRGSFFREKP